MPSHIGNTLIEAFLAHAAHHPGRLALSDEDGPQWTYAELRRRVTATARVLAERGVRPGGRVAVVGGRTADTVTALLAVLCAGGTYSVLDPALPQARQEVVLADLEPDALLATIDPRPQGAPVVRLGEVAPVDGKHVADGRAGDLAYVMYTSGSTG